MKQCLANGTKMNGACLQNEYNSLHAIQIMNNDTESLLAVVVGRITRRGSAHGTGGKWIEWRVFLGFQLDRISIEESAGAVSPKFIRKGKAAERKILLATTHMTS